MTALEVTSNHLTIRRYQDARNLLQILVDAGFPAMLAGGCVRDRLIGRDPEDYDIATTATPDDVMKVLSGKGLKVVPTGVAHGTVTVVCRFSAVEVTTLRRDVATDGRHAEVQFGYSFEEDAQRRDFTINAMFEDLDGKVVDYVGGQGDLNNQVLKFVGDAEKRIKEDYLRILRLFRFWARFDFIVDQSTLAVIENHKSGISKLSQERVTAEVLKLLASPAATRSLAAMVKSGVWDMIMPELPFGKVEDAFFKNLGVPRDLSALLRIWLGMTGDRPDLAALGTRLRLSTKQVSVLLRFTELWDGVQSVDTESIADVLLLVERSQHHLSPTIFAECFLPLLALDQGLKTTVDKVQQVFQKYGYRLGSLMPITGQDLMGELKIAPGAEVGRLLAELRRGFLAGTWSEKAEGLILAQKLKT